MEKQTFANARPGDEVMAFPHGNGVVKLNLATDETNLNDGTGYPIVVEFANGHEVRYTLDGYQFRGAKLPSLYWRGTYLCEAPPPRRKVKKTITRWTNIYSNGFASFYKTREDAEGSKHHFDYPYVTTVMVTVPYEEEI